MRNYLIKFVCSVVVSLGVSYQTQAADLPQFRDLFNGKDLTGWVDVNTSKDTWSVRDGMLICSGQPNGVMRTEKQYENFVLHVEWRHMKAGGNSGMQVWASGTLTKDYPWPKCLEIQMLDLGYIELRKRRDGVSLSVAYVHGELFGVDGLTVTPDNPRGKRSKSIENRCKGNGEWNVYDVVCVDGVAKLAVNGKFVNGISNASVKKGYICLESEGGEIHFRNIKIMELPPGVTSAEQTAPIAKTQ